MSAGVSININLTGALKKLSDSNIKRGRYAMANQMLPDMNRFVPADSYDLRGTGHVESDGSQITWTSVYALAQFHGTNGKAIFRNYTIAGTGKRWDLVATPIYINDWVHAFTKGAGL